LTLIIAAGCIVLLLAVVLVALFRKVFAPARAEDVDPVWLHEFDVETYRPMERLLDPDDYEFLEKQDGYRPGMARELRKKRQRILRQYLQGLGRDFDRLHRTARLLVLYAPSDQPELVRELLKQSTVFWGSMAIVRLRLAVPLLGAVDFKKLLGTTQWMRGQVAVYLPAR